MAVLFPEMPPGLRSYFPEFFWNWWQALRTWLLQLEGRVSVIDGGVP